MKEFIITALDVNRHPIASIVSYCIDYSHAVKIGKHKFPDAIYWTVGEKL